MSRLASIMLCLGALVVLCIPFAEAAGPDTPQALIDAWVRAWNAHDTKALASLYADDADWLKAQGTFLKDRAAILADHERTQAAGFRSATFTAKITALRLPRPDIAVIRHDSLITGVLDPAGNPIPPRHARALVVAAKMADGWRIIAKQHTFPPEPK